MVHAPGAQFNCFVSVFVYISMFFLLDLYLYLEYKKTVVNRFMKDVGISVELRKY